MASIHRTEAAATANTRTCSTILTRKRNQDMHQQRQGQFIRPIDSSETMVKVMVHLFENLLQSSCSVGYNCAPAAHHHWRKGQFSGWWIRETNDSLNNNNFPAIGRQTGIRSRADSSPKGSFKWKVKPLDLYKFAFPAPCCIPRTNSFPFSLCSFIKR